MFKHIISHLTIYLVTYIFLLLLFFGVHFTIPRHDFQRAEIIPFTPKIPFSQQLFCRQKKRIVFSLTDNLKRFPLALFESPPEDDAAHGPVEAHRKSDSHNAHVHPDCKNHRENQADADGREEGNSHCEFYISCRTKAASKRSGVAECNTVENIMQQYQPECQPLRLLGHRIEGKDKRCDCKDKRIPCHSNDQCDFYQLAEIILRLISISRAHALSDDGDEYWGKCTACECRHGPYTLGNAVCGNLVGTKQCYHTGKCYFDELENTALDTVRNCDTEDRFLEA